MNTMVTFALFLGVLHKGGETMRILKRIGVKSAARIAGVAYGLMGLVFGAFMSIAALISASTGQTTGIQGLIFGVGSIIVLPIFYGVMGYIMTLIAAAFFNWVVQWTGGLEVEVETPQVSQSPQVASESLSQ